MMTLNPLPKLNRLATILRSFKAIYKLSPAEVDAYIKSHEVYEYEWVDGEAIQGSKKMAYAEVKQSLLNWYGVVNHLCAIGVVEKMYIPPTMNLKASVIENQLLIERKFAEWLDMKAGDNILELGCGKGRITAHLASITGACITGINIDQGQVDNATQFAKKNRLSKQCQFINADFNDIPFPFPDQHFDSIYEVQALACSRDLEKLFFELNRMLKPNGKVSLCEWVRLPKYDPDNAHHRSLLNLVKPLVGAIGTPSPAEYETALQNAGFDVLISMDPSVNKSQEVLVDKAGNAFDKILPLIHFLVKIKILPKHFIQLFDQLGKNVEALCEADRLGLIAQSYQFVAQKQRDIPH